MALNFRLRLGDWFRTSKGREFLLVLGVVSFLLVVGAFVRIFSPEPQTSTYTSTKSSDSGGDDDGAKRELEKLSWVRGTYVSPGYMNVGVDRREKDWSSPMIGASVCGILKRYGSSISRVRFVDADKVLSEQVPVQSAEISVHYCR